MSILIKGMEIPKAGQVIEIAQNVDGKMFARLEPSFDSWHEIVIVPTPHGRLIDADVFDKHMKQTPRYFSMCCDLEEQPTIIEAEGEKDE